MLHALCNAHITEMKLLKMVSNKRNNATNKVPLEPKKIQNHTVKFDHNDFFVLHTELKQKKNRHMRQCLRS